MFTFYATARINPGKILQAQGMGGSLGARFRLFDRSTGNPRSLGFDQYFDAHTNVPAAGIELPRDMIWRRIWGTVSLSGAPDVVAHLAGYTCWRWCLQNEYAIGGGPLLGQERILWSMSETEAPPPPHLASGRPYLGLEVDIGADMPPFPALSEEPFNVPSPVLVQAVIKFEPLGAK